MTLFSLNAIIMSVQTGQHLPFSDHFQEHAVWSLGVQNVENSGLESGPMVDQWSFSGGLRPEEPSGADHIQDFWADSFPPLIEMQCAFVQPIQ